MKKLLILAILLLTIVGCQKKYLEYQKPTGVIADMSGYQGLISEQFYDITVDEILKIENRKPSLFILVMKIALV